jgi:hypothetical protein
MDPKANEEIIDGICDYCEKKQVKAIFQEYMKRLIVAKPSDPVAFLLKSVEEDPFVLSNPDENTEQS